MVKKCKKLNKIPVFYAYMIPFEARARFKFQDCDVDPWNNVCVKGANFIRQNRNILVGRYSHYAQQIASFLGDKNARNRFFLISKPKFLYFFFTT
jgi:hypothetical protein